MVSLKGRPQIGWTFGSTHDPSKAPLDFIAKSRQHLEVGGLLREHHAAEIQKRALDFLRLFTLRSEQEAYEFKEILVVRRPRSLLLPRGIQAIRRRGQQKNAMAVRPAAPESERDWVRQGVRRIDQHLPELLELIEDDNVRSDIAEHRLGERRPQAAHKMRREFLFRCLQYGTGVYGRQVQVLVFSETLQKSILEFSNAFDILVVAQRRVPAGFPRLIATALRRERSRIARWASALQEP